jgi:UDP-GlcNAc:undecaprenyl-phosphate/decaprenyl-phosphate GlcNAc-1-phosphate transferase
MIAPRPAAGAISTAIAFAFAVALVPIVKTLCVRWRLFDLPGPLKIHSRPIPRLGGVAVAFAIAAAAFLSGPHRAIVAWPFFAALGLIFICGLIDDLWGLSPIFRLVVQFSAGFLLWRGGWTLPLLPGGAPALLAVCAFVALLANSMNLLDGSDGVAAGVAAVISAAYLAVPGPFGNTFASTVAWTLVGACVAFLLSNWPPATIFLGDCGSTVLGFGVAFFALTFWRLNSTAGPALVFPLLVAGLPLLDLALAVIRRLRRHGSAFRGDRAHFYDLLLARGWPRPRVALACCGISAVFSGIGLLGMRGELLQFWSLTVLSVASFLFLAVKLGSLRSEQRGWSVQKHLTTPIQDERGEAPLLH